MDRLDIERLFHTVVSESILKENLIVNKAGFTSAYVQLGQAVRDLDRGRKIVMGMVIPGQRMPPTSRTGAGAAGAAGAPAKKRLTLPHNGSGVSNAKALVLGKQRFLDEESEEEIQITKVVTKKKRTTTRSTQSRRVQAEKMQHHQQEESDDGEYVASDEDVSDDAEDEDANDPTLNGFVVDSDDEEDEEEEIDSDVEVVPNAVWKSVATQKQPNEHGQDAVEQLYSELQDCVSQVSLLRASRGDGSTVVTLKFERSL